MKNHDQRADNLLSRLFAYAPREGRLPLEDFCTETLAWCLRQSPSFQRSFLRLTEIPSLHDCDGLGAVHTQVSFYGRVDEVDASDPQGGRFDLVIESGVTNPFVLVVESKIGAGFEPDQLPKYLRHMADRQAFDGVPMNARHLITLTSSPCERPPNVKGILWRDVQALIGSGPGEGTPLVEGLFEQFATFLEEKGLAMLKLKKVDNQLLTGWTAAKKLERQLRRIIAALKKEDDLIPTIGGQKVSTSDDGGWVGVGGKNSFWAGFGIAKIGGELQLFMWVEITVKGDCRGAEKNFDTETKTAFEAAKNYVKAFPDDDGSVNAGNLVKGQSRFVFVARLEGEFDGKGDKALDWLVARSRTAIELAGRTKLNRR